MIARDRSPVLLGFTGIPAPVGLNIAWRMTCIRLKFETKGERFWAWPNALSLIENREGP